MAPTKVVLATGNAGKLRELRELLAAQSIAILAQSEFECPEAIEDGLSFVENAIIKARNAADHTGLPAIGDDSGLEVDALDGEPGIYSARYAGDKASDANNWQKLLQQLENVPSSARSARFRCAMVYVRHGKDPAPIICEGAWEGFILDKPSGDNGFGYDPVFYVPSHDCSAAELDAETKNALSHRGQALQQLVARLSHS